MNELGEMEKLRYKGRFITTKQLAKRKQILELNKNKKKTLECTSDSTLKNCASEKNQSSMRLIDVSFLAKHLNCHFCKEKIFLEDIEKESRREWGSIFSIRCKKCLNINKVPSGPNHEGPNGTVVFDVNTKAALGALQTGVGCEAVNKILQTMGLPPVHSNTLKNYEKEIRSIIEEVAKSGEKACEFMNHEFTVRQLNP